MSQTSSPSVAGLRLSVSLPTGSRPWHCTGPVYPSTSVHPSPGLRPAVRPFAVFAHIHQDCIGIFGQAFAGLVDVDFADARPRGLNHGEESFRVLHGRMVTSHYGGVNIPIG